MAAPRKPRTKRNGSPVEATKQPAEGLSQDDVARRVPCSQQTVSRFMRRGFLTQTDNGRLSEVAIEEVRARMEENEVEDGEAGDLKLRYDRATARLKEAQAQLRELELKIESGKFVELAVVQADGADCGERVVGVLRSVPQRVAMALECGCRTASVVEVKVREDVERAIAEIHDSSFVKVPEEETT